MTKGDLKKHKKEKHETNSHNFYCHLCQKNFVTRDKLVRHRYKVHRQQSKELVCKYCDTTFRSPGVLYSHITLHTGQRPYKCGLCPATFANTHGSSTHRRSHLVNGKYQCSVCSKEISSSLSMLKIHLRDEHNEDICTVDPIDYKQHTYLRRTSNKS